MQCCTWVNDHLFLMFSSYSLFPFVWFWCFIGGCFEDIVGLFDLIVCFIVIGLDWGPVVGSSQVSVMWFYFIQYHFVWLPHLCFYFGTPWTLRCSWLIPMMLGVMLHSCPVPSTCLLLWMGASFHSACRLVRWGISFVFLLFSFSSHCLLNW